MKYIDAEKLIAEIEKRQEERQDRRDSASLENEYWPESKFCTRDDEDDAIISIITSLQQEQPCHPFNVDEAAGDYYEQDCPYPGEARVVNNEHDVWFPSQAIEDAFIAGASWQKQHDAELIEIAYNDGITIGMTKQKEQDEKEQADLFTIVALDAAQRAREQMMKEAVEGWVAVDSDTEGKRRVTFFPKKPVRDVLTEYKYWAATRPNYESIKLDSNAFPELKWEDEPKKVHIVIVKE